MTEAKWLVSNNPLSLLYDSLTSPTASRAGFRVHGQLVLLVRERQLRLFACACCRYVWDTITDPRSRKAVEVAERYAYGLATLDELKAADIAAGNAWQAAIPSNKPRMAEIAAWMTSTVPRTALMSHELAKAVDATAALGMSPRDQADAIRDIIGNPWRPVRLPYVCLYCGSAEQKPGGTSTRCGRCGQTAFGCPWLTPDVIDLARAACEGCLSGGVLDPARLAVLADALEEAGCGVGRVLEHNDGATHYWYNEAFGRGWPHLTPDRSAEHPLIAHLRGPGTHLRGCWAVDLFRRHFLSTMWR